MQKRRRLRRFMRRLRDPRLRWVRVPIAVLFILGGVVGFLPVVGFWMAPLGLMLLAIDVPAVRPLERRVRGWWRRFRNRRRNKGAR